MPGHPKSFPPANRFPLILRGYYQIRHGGRHLTPCQETGLWAAGRHLHRQQQRRRRSSRRRHPVPPPPLPTPPTWNGGTGATSRFSALCWAGSCSRCIAGSGACASTPARAKTVAFSLRASHWAPTSGKWRPTPCVPLPPSAPLGTVLRFSPVLCAPAYTLKAEGRTRPCIYISTPRLMAANGELERMLVR